MVTDRYQDIVLHHDRVDWTRPDLSATYLSRLFLGTHDYWDEEEFEGMKPHEIEKEILFEGGRDNWHGVSPYGKPYYQHFLSLMKLLFPETDITHTIADAVMFFCLGLGHKKVLNLIGCQNAGKSAGAIRIVFVCMYVDPHYTVAHVANPFDNAADSTVWGDVEELWDELVTTFPCDTNPDAPSLFPTGRKYANKSLIFIPGQPKAARIDLKNVKHVGKYKGSKTRGKQTHRGIMFVIVDEINEIDNPAFLTALENLSSQKAFFCITSQNFKDEEDMGGQITHPVPTFGGPAEFEDLEVDYHLHWHSAKASITLRFDGHKAPNILATTGGDPPVFPTPEDEGNLLKPVILYPYLIDPGDLIRLRESGGGEESLIYASQARSFPVRGGAANSVLSKPKISASRHKDPHYQMVIVRGSVAFSDPAFGGRDAAVWGCAHFGEATILDPGGAPISQEIIEFKDYMKKLKLVRGAYYNEYWFERMAAAGIPTTDITPGAEISFEDQIAIQCRELNQANGVPPANFGYDFSMRPDIVSSVNKIIGFEACAFDYNDGPEGFFIENIKKKTEDCCKNRVTELAFLAADVFLTKQLRGGSFIDAATTQLSRTNYAMVGKKYVAEDKAAYKTRWQNRSPDERDTLMGIVGMAHKRGFRKQSAAGATGASDPWEEINARNLGKKRVIQRLR